MRLSNSFGKFSDFELRPLAQRLEFSTILDKSVF